MVDPLLIRPLRTDDVETADRLPVQLSGGRPPGGGWDPGRAIARHLIHTDPEGCWVAEHGGRPIGLALSARRELTWLLTGFGVAPHAEAAGTTRALLEAAQHYGRGCLRAIAWAGPEPGLARTYREAGFTLHPTMTLTGIVDRSAVPSLRHVRDARSGDRDLMDSLDRRVRGSAHGPDHEVLGALYHAVVVDRPGSSGYAYAAPTGPVLVAATDRRTAAALTWECLAAAPGAVAVPRVTAANEWAVDVGHAAGLSLGVDGYLCLRHLKPPAPYLPHETLL